MCGMLILEVFIKKSMVWRKAGFTMNLKLRNPGLVRVSNDKAFVFGGNKAGQIKISFTKVRYIFLQEGKEASRAAWMYDFKHRTIETAEKMLEAKCT